MKYAEAKTRFAEMQPLIRKRVEEQLGSAGLIGLQIVTDIRADGAYWYDYRGIRVRTELTAAKHVAVVVYDDEHPDGRRLAATIENADFTGDVIVAVLRGNA